MMLDCSFSLNVDLSQLLKLYIFRGRLNKLRASPDPSPDGLACLLGWPKAGEREIRRLLNELQNPFDTSRRERLCCNATSLPRRSASC